MCSFKNYINLIFLNKITIYKYNYKLIVLVTQSEQINYVVYFENYFNSFSSILNKQFQYNDIIGHYKEFKNIELNLENIRDYEPVVLLVYLKIRLINC